MMEKRSTQQQATKFERLLTSLTIQREAWRQRLTARWRQVARPLAMALTLALFLLSATLTSFAQAGTAWYTPVHAAAALPPGKNTFQQTTDLGKRVILLPQMRGHKATSTQVSATPRPVARPSAVSMQPSMLALSTTHPLTWTSNDKRLSVSIPAGAVTPALVTQGNGAVWLQVTQLEGPSGGTGAGNSGKVSLGTYQFTLYGRHTIIKAPLAKPITLSFSLKGWRGAAFDAAHLLFVLNGSVPVSAQATTTQRVATATKAKPLILAASLNRQQWSVQTIIPAAATGGSSSGSWDTNTPQGHWDAQADTSVDLSGGDLTYSYPLNVPPGPDGLTPKVTLSYDSSSVANEHNPQATSGWLGEGWNLSLGSISWGEDNAYSRCSPTCGYQWENSWHMSDPYGNGGELIPQDSNVSPWYDDTSFSLTTGAISWNLENDPRVKIVSYNHPNSNFPSANYPTQPPCFRAFLPNGYMEEFGCTGDSLQFYVNTNAQNYKSNYIYRWDLDMIVDPSGNQIHINYSLYKNWSKADGATKFPIDAVPSTITYDSPSCHSTTTMCTGSSWQPAVQISFQNATTPTRLTGSACPTFTNTTTYTTSQTMRCDDVQDLSTQTPPGVAAPVMQSLAILNDVLVQVTTTPSAPAWQTLRDYQFTFAQTPSTTTTDPVTATKESIAGDLTLTQVQEIGDNGATSLPPLTMTYSTVNKTEYYIDTAYTPASGGGCGPSWNATNCYLWSEITRPYMITMNNGRGWYETYTYAPAHNNTHGVNAGLTLEDPLACDGTNESASPCNIADDENWSKMVVTQRQASVRCVRADGTGCGNNGTGSALLSSTYSYTYRLTDVTRTECSPNCTVDMYWGNQNDADKLDFYNTHFMGFHTTQVTSPDGSQQLYTFYSGEGYGVATSTITCHSGYGCAVAPWTDMPDFLHGKTQEEDDYDTNGTTLLKKTTTSYVSGTAACPSNGITGSPHNSTDNTLYYGGQRTSEQDFNNPVTVCEIEPAQTVESVYDGGTNHVDTTTAYTYTYNGFHMTVQSADTSASDNSQTPHIVQKTQYAWDDNLTLTSSSANGTYFNMLSGIQTTEDGSGNIKACTYTAYDGGTAGATGSQSSITKGLLTRTDRYATNCTPGSLSGQVSSVRAYNGNGDLLATEDADALAGISGHTNATNCTVSSVAYTACATYDSLYGALVKQVYNDDPNQPPTVLNYTDDGSNSNSPDASNGWGQWLTTTTDANSQVTAFGYDALGRLTATAQSGDTLAAPTNSNSYPVNCPTNTSSEPCYSLTTTQQMSSSPSVTYTNATYYDGWGRAVETVKPENTTGSSTTWSVSYTEYDGSGRKQFVSDPYFVTTSSTTPAYHRPDTTQPGTQYYYDGLGRVVKTIDPLQYTTTTTYTVDQPTAAANISDTNYFEVTTVVDANSHKHRELSDGLGHTRYVEQFSGNGGSVAYALYGTSRADYNWLGNTTATYEPTNYPTALAAGVNTTAQASTTYDLLGRAASMTDADLGTVTQTYDANGNVTSTVDPRGSSGGTTYIGYDGLNRVIWRNTANSPTNAYAAYTYDQTGSSYGYGIGRLTTATFNNTNAPSGSPSLSGSYTYNYDNRGQQIGVTQTMEGTAYPFTSTYNDAGQPTSLQYSDNELLTYTYNGYGWLTDLMTKPSGGTTANLLTNISYSGNAGAAGKPTSASVGGTVYTYSATYDNDLRQTGESLSTSAGVDYSTTRTYDAVSNVTGVNTTLAGNQTDNQAFCYNEQNQLTWASSATGTPPCGGSNTAGSLMSAVYTQAFAYDAMGRLTSSATGSYTYGDSAHSHAATAITGGTTYSAAYDSAGDMVCRATTSATTCSGTATGQTLAYDNLRRLTHWQNTPTSPTSTDDFLYDGSGQRVEQQSVATGTTTDTDYLLGGVEEITGGVVTKYLGVAGLPTAIRVGTSGSLNYLASDGLGSVSEALDGAGNVVATQLYTPYGQTRYSSGTMPTSKGFTGQRADAVSGLDYYGARYYDPVAGQFTEADSANDGLSRYAYVKGNPETLSDPSGRSVCQPNTNNCIGPNPGGIKSIQRMSKWVDMGSDGNAGELWDYITYLVITYNSGAVVDTDYHTKKIDVCDNDCAQQRNQKAKDNAANGLSFWGGVWMLVGSVLAAAGGLLLGFAVAALKGLLAVVLSVLAFIGAGTALFAASSIPGGVSQALGTIGAIMTVFAAGLSTVLAMSGGLIFLTAGLAAVKAAIGIASGGIGTVLQLGGGLVLSALGYFAQLEGEGLLLEASSINSTSVSDWCAAGGACQSSNTGALQKAGLLPPCYLPAGCNASPADS